MPILVALLGFTFYDVVYGSITRDQAPPLMLQVLMSSFVIFGNFITPKAFDLTVVTLAFNSSPLVIAILAYPILGETLTKW